MLNVFRVPVHRVGVTDTASSRARDARMNACPPVFVYPISTVRAEDTFTYFKPPLVTNTNPRSSSTPHRAMMAVVSGLEGMEGVPHALAIRVPRIEYWMKLLTAVKDP